MHCEWERKLSQELSKDPTYQQLLADCLLAGEDYLRIRDQLSPDDRAILERYLSLCEESDHRRLFLLFLITSAKQSL